MIRNIFIVVFVLVMVGCGTSEDPGAGVSMSVEESFDALKGALRDGDGTAAVSYVTPATVEMYERCRKLSLDSSGTDLESISQLEVLLAFQLRWSQDKATLETMDGVGIFVWGVEEGMVNKEVIAQIELDKVQVEGDKALATLINQGERVTDLVFDFERHDGIWKLDLYKVLKITDPAFAAVREETGKTKIELAIYLIERTYNEKVPPQILNGPLK